MKDNFQKYKLEDFLDDHDFCRWAKSNDPELAKHYHQFLEKYPEQKTTFHEAYQIIRLLEDEKLTTDPRRKLEMWKNIGAAYNKGKKTLTIKRTMRYAAGIMIVFSISALAWYFAAQNNSMHFQTAYNIQDYSQTHLKLDDGRLIPIDSERSSVEYLQAGNQIEVDGKAISLPNASSKTEHNELIVPFGKQSKVILADHTEIWLNAGSRLVYPSHFEKNSRNVQLQGEAYFQVRKDPLRPFIVETANSKIEVLGTSFNVKAYPDEDAEETVLVEGVISLNPGKKLWGSDIIVKPDQQVIVDNTNDSYAVRQVDAETYTSWIDGLFIFNEAPLPRVLKRVARFYDIDIDWSSAAEEKIVSGKLDLKEDFQRVLDAVALISNGNYSENDREVFFKLKNEEDVTK
ncbi:FecR family protein [Sunxiuqinia indica]|uniref:FecR family protein n=1 Tax=Sunxiuqinia indica TaxID=2692584 RepID=UPI001357B51C|nr:FecR domain-containing protein [Sunxiuqinia indica]